MTSYGKLALVLSSLIVLRGDDAQTFRDPSRHSVNFVTVDENVKLEVLDWGGRAGGPSCSLRDRGTQHTS
jgi:hypothetical protein